MNNNGILYGVSVEKAIVLFLQRRIVSSARIFIDFGLLVIRGQSVAQESMGCDTLLGTLLGVQVYKKVKFPGRDISSLAA